MTDGTALAADYTEQAGFLNSEKFGHTITYVGCGGIGSNNRLPATLGIRRIVLIDPKTVVDRNVGNSTTFGPKHIGQPKVEVLREAFLELGVPEVIAYQRRFMASDRENLGTIVITGLDSMAARQEVWQLGFAPFNTNVRLLIDCRTDGPECQVLCVNPFDLRPKGDVEWYTGKQLFDDPPEEQVPCGEVVQVNNRRNWPGAAAQASVIVAARLAQFSRGEPLERILSMDTDQMLITNRLGAYVPKPA